MLQELLLQRVQAIAVSHVLDGLDVASLCLGTEHEARTDEAVVDHNAACAAVAGGTTFLAASQMQGFTKDVE